MSVVSRLSHLAANPLEAGYRLRALVDADGLWRRQERLCRRAGMGRGAFILSFDCDTEKDIRVAAEVHARLADAGITPVYAVPGALLERGEAVYRRLHEAGASFINHGYAEHTSLDESTGIYESLLFYDRMEPELVRHDITAGHAALARVLGIVPTGFRTPHFGSYQGGAQMRFLYDTLTALGYRYSSSAAPFVSCCRGPHRVTAGLWEVPVTGCRTQPLRILDSWGFRFAPGHRRPEEYVAEAAGLRDLLAAGSCCLVNLYADPSQVHDWPEFFTAMAAFAPWAMNSYDELLEGLGP